MFVFVSNVSSRVHVLLGLASLQVPRYEPLLFSELWLVNVDADLPSEVLLYEANSGFSVFSDFDST